MRDRPAGLREVESFATRLDVLTFDGEAAGHYAEIRADFERKGAVIGPYDLMGWWW